MSCDTFDTLLATLRRKLQRPPENVLAIGLYRLAPGGSFDNVGIVTNVGKATDVVNALYDFRNGVIKFPLTKPRQELPSQRSKNYVIYET